MESGWNISPNPLDVQIKAIRAKEFMLHLNYRGFEVGLVLIIAF